MKAVIQRVKGVKLTVDGEAVASAGRGLVVYVGIEQSDTEADVLPLASKLVAMRIFADGDGKMNLSVSSVGGDVLLVPNFTLCADISHGNRPSFTNAMRPAVSASLMFDRVVEVVTDLMRGSGGKVGRGIFGADMTIDQINDGPVTIIY